MSMFMIAAMVQPFRIEQVRSELLSSGIQGLTATLCCGHGRQPRLVDTFWGEGKIPELLDKIKIEVAVVDADVDAAVDAIVRGARLGAIGDGKIFISEIEHAVSINNGAKDELALHPRREFIEAAE
ncbi:MAG: P-II family nitrogen regulator [Hyphomicrobiaceae bacterium]|nr:P-II family nitrogen regulator [Hyphomicrobiaceae bacterium]